MLSKLMALADDRVGGRLPIPLTWSSPSLKRLVVLQRREESIQGGSRNRDPPSHSDHIKLFSFRLLISVI